jgi:hypothetical protein
VLAFHWLLRYRHGIVIIIHDRYVDKVSRATEGSASTGGLIDALVSKCGITDANPRMVQESVNAVTARRTRLADLTLENGEMFRLELASDTRRLSSSASRSFSEPVPAAIQAFRAEWGENAVSAAEVTGRDVVIEQQEAAAVKRILLPEEECGRIAHIICELHFVTPRLFLLYGTLPSESVVRVHCAALPAQTFSGGRFAMNEAHKRSADELAKVLGLQLAGVVVCNQAKRPPFDSEVLMAVGRIAPEIGDFFTVVAGLPDAGLCHFEAFQLSSQFIRELNNGLFVGPAGRCALRTKSAVVLYSKASETVGVNYLIVNVAIKTRASWFPRSLFPFQALYPTIADFAEAIDRDFEVPDFVRLLDFNMLLFLEQWFTPGNEIPMIARTCVAKKSLPIGITAKLDEIRASAALMKS